MVCGETALAFLNRNRLLYLDMLEPIRRGTAELLYTESDGVLLYDRLAEAHMLGADTPQALERMLPLMEGCTILTGHQLWYKDRLAAQFGLTCEQICHQAAWLEETRGKYRRTRPIKTPPFIPTSTEVVLTNVAGDPNAIGYVSLGALNDTVKVSEVDRSVYFPLWSPRSHAAAAAAMTPVPQERVSYSTPRS